MAITLVATIQQFQGVSTDEKPASPPEGSTLHLVDTGEQLVYYDGMWEEDLRMIAAMRAV